jgi:RNA polymerase sigma factor (sigma-70 family)
VEASALTHAQRRGRLHVRSSLLRLQRDDRLIALMRSGNEAAFEVLFERYRPRLLGFCRHMLGSAEDAEDVLQEVFVAAYKAILADEREIAVKPWLYRIARNRSLNHLRRPVAEGQDTMDDRPHQNGVSTHDRVQQREEFRNLLADIVELPETQRTALLLREIDALSYEEIGVAMETTIPSVKSLLVRARVSLAEASEARMLTCADVRIELGEAVEGIGRASGPARRHLRDCEECKGFRAQLRTDAKAMAILFPVGPLALIKSAVLSKLGGAATGGSGAASAGGSVGAGSASGLGGAIGSAIAGKATAGVVTAALITTGVVEMHRVTQHDGAGSRAAVTAPRVAQPLPEAEGLHRSLERRRGVDRRALLNPEADRPVAKEAGRRPPQRGGDLASANSLDHLNRHTASGGVAAPRYQQRLADPKAASRRASGASVGRGPAARRKAKHVGLPPVDDAKPCAALNRLPVTGEALRRPAGEASRQEGKRCGNRVAVAVEGKRLHR